MTTLWGKPIEKYRSVRMLKQVTSTAKGEIEIFHLDGGNDAAFKGVNDMSALLDGEKATARRSAFLCPHCSRVCVVIPGSGRERGYCFRCSKPTCGAQDCVSCAPFEAKLEAMEGRRRFHKQLGGY